MSTVHRARVFCGYVFDDIPENWTGLAWEYHDLFHTIEDYRAGNPTYVAGIVTHEMTECEAVYIPDPGDLTEIRQRIQKAAPDISLPDHDPRPILAMDTY